MQLRPQTQVQTVVSCLGAGSPLIPLHLVYGMGVDVATIAASLALWGADLLSPGLSFSIGGPPPPSLLGGLLGGILGKAASTVIFCGAEFVAGAPTGLSYTHNQFESDSSATRGDFYQFECVHPLEVYDFQYSL